MKALVEIKGGFGNQIFQYAFANSLKEKGFKVSVNIQKNLNKEEMLDNKIFGFPKSSILFVQILNLLYRILESNKLGNKNRHLINKIFRKFFVVKDFENIEGRFFNHFDGYWQNVELLVSQKKFILDCLKNIEPFKDLKEKDCLHGSTLIHVRRGDYLNYGEELSLNFYYQAIKYCENNIKNFKFEIFTDDINWVKSHYLFDNALNIHGPTRSLNNLLKEVYKMLNFENYVVGNSSFSLVAAILSEDERSKIIVADPWMRNSKHDLKFKNNWIKIKNITNS